ncbi:MAG: pantetheine-phosphate adenylyltransferase [Myxococcales bacterium]|nr:pantetheine-phosphate adenylyltransferase [Myxococcales bacterium]
MADPRIAIYPGSFDPITNGHIDIMLRALTMFDKVIVAIAQNVRKAPLFTVAERRQQILDAVGSPNRTRVEIDAFEGLLVDYVHKRGARIVVRGLRALADFEYEFQLAHMNRRLGKGIDTIFLMTSEKDFYVSSSLVKEVAQFGGKVTGLVPTSVEAALYDRLGRKNEDRVSGHENPAVPHVGRKRQGQQAQSPGRGRDRVRRR